MLSLLLTQDQVHQHHDRRWALSCIDKHLSPTRPSFIPTWPRLGVKAWGKEHDERSATIIVRSCRVKKVFLGRVWRRVNIWSGTYRIRNCFDGIMPSLNLSVTIRRDYTLRVSRLVKIVTRRNISCMCSASSIAWLCRCFTSSKQIFPIPGRVECITGAQKDTLCVRYAVCCCLNIIRLYHMGSYDSLLQIFWSKWHVLFSLLLVCIYMRYTCRYIQMHICIDFSFGHGNQYKILLWTGDTKKNLRAWACPGGPKPWRRHRPGLMSRSGPG